MTHRIEQYSNINHIFCPYQEDLRCDGRNRLDYRPIVFETGLVSNASGSSRLRLANSDILVGVKVELDVPLPEKPSEGRLEFFVDW